MPSRPFILVVAFAMSLSACASPSSVGALSDYWGVGFTNVTTRCGGGYRVYQKANEPKLLVRAYEVSEARRSFCEMYNGIQQNAGVTGVRHEEAATEYLAKISALKSCRLVSGTEITALHSEFVYSCPTHPDLAIMVKG